MTDPLRNYVVARQEVVAAVRSAQLLLAGVLSRSQSRDWQALLEKLAEDRFNLAVVGQFKRGKSSLMNAVVGRELLPTGVLPVTSAITTLCYGPQERVRLIRKGMALEHEIALAELGAYVTEAGNPGNKKGIVEARLELPDPFLRRGLHFVDTPGVGSARRENTATTYAFLPQVDAVIFVTSVDAPLSATEAEFLQHMRYYVRKMFVVVNKVDLLAPAEREAVLAYVHDGIEVALGTAAPQPYLLSALHALQGKLARDEVQVERSGLKTLEAALASFLAEERTAVFLVGILDRALRLLVEIDEALGSDRRTEINALREAMESQRAALTEGASLPLAPPPARDRSGDLQILEQAIADNRASAHSNNPHAAQVGATCPICAAQSQAIFDFFAHWQHLLVTSETARRAFVAARGFCHAHTWQLQQIGSPQSISEGYAPLVEATAAELRGLFAETSAEVAARLEQLSARHARCAACRVLRDAEADHLTRFLSRIATPEGLEDYVHSPGLCLPHLRAVLAASLPPEVADFLLREQIRQLEETSEDMRSYVLKRAARRRAFLNAKEEAAWRRALVQLVGEQTVQDL